MTVIRRMKSEFGDLWERDCTQPENSFMASLTVMLAWIPEGDRSPGVHMWSNYRHNAWITGDFTVYQYIRVVRPGFWMRLLNSSEAAKIDSEIRAFNRVKDEWNGNLHHRG